MSNDYKTEITSFYERVQMLFVSWQMERQIDRPLLIFAGKNDEKTMAAVRNSISKETILFYLCLSNKDDNNSESIFQTGQESPYTITERAGEAVSKDKVSILITLLNTTAVQFQVQDSYTSGH